MLRKMRLFLWAQVTEGVRDMVWDDWLRSEIIGQVTEGVSGPGQGLQEKFELYFLQS